jgi:hypothetical protein
LSDPRPPKFNPVKVKSETHRSDRDMRWVSQGLNPTCGLQNSAISTHLGHLGHDPRTCKQKQELAWKLYPGPF